MHQGEGEPRGGGTVMSHPFQEGAGGGGTVMSHPKKGWGTVMSHPKGACPKGGSTNHNQGEGVGGRLCYCGPTVPTILLV